MTAPDVHLPTTTNQTWQAAMEWVRANMPLIKRVATPYFPFMAAERDDLLQEATIAAFHTFTVLRNRQAPQRFIPFFRVIFKTQCLKLAAGIQSTRVDDFHLQSLTQETEEDLLEPFQSEVEEALQQIGEQERKMCTWILEQPQPVSTLETSRHFKVSQRQICRLLHKTLEQLTKAA